MYRINIQILADKLATKLSKEIRVLAAIILGCAVIILTHRGLNLTKADVFFAEMIHTMSDTLIIALLFIAFNSQGWILKILGKISGALLCFAGITAFAKAYTTFIQVIATQGHAVERKDVLLVVSVSTILLIMLQMALIWSEHGILHGETSTDLHHVHSGAKTELIADAMQAFAGLFEYVLILAIPDAPLFVRFADTALTISLGWWMCKRGVLIIFPKREHHHHDHH